MCCNIIKVKRFYCVVLLYAAAHFLMLINTKGEKTMDHLIEELYKNADYPYDRSMNKDGHYNYYNIQVSKQYKKLLKDLSGEDLKEFERFAELISMKYEKRCMYCFKAGFKTGTSLLLESLDMK